MSAIRWRWSSPKRVKPRCRALKHSRSRTSRCRPWSDCSKRCGRTRRSFIDDAPGNLCFEWDVGDKAATDAAFRDAAHVARISLVNNRLVGNPMEPRAAIGEYDPGTGQYTLWTTSQFPHIVKVLMGVFVLKIPQHKLRVIAPDVGGGFGVKQFHYSEEALVTWAASKLARPVKWVCDRSEGFVSDAHGRDHVSEAELALDENGKFLALRVETVANMGGYLSTFGPNIPTNLYGLLLAGVYTTPQIYCLVKGVFTNTLPVDAYRGAGRPEATFLLERLVDVAASEMGISKVDIRRRNLIPKDAYPYQTPVMLEYDSGDPAACLDRALEIADWEGLCRPQGGIGRERKIARHRALYLYRGLWPCAVADCGRLGARGGLFESATVRVHPTGDITVLIGTHNHGQGHETTFAQIVSEKLGLPTDRIEIVFGDTDKVQFGLGTYGSRSLAVGGPALARLPTRSSRKARRSQRIFWKPATAISSSRPDCFGFRVPIAPRASRRLPAPPTRRSTIRWNSSSPASRSKPSTIRSISPIPVVRILPRSRSTRRPASSTFCPTSRWTTSDA